MARNFEDILESVGSYGRYQKQMMVLNVMAIGFLVAMERSSLVFQTVVPDHWCDVLGRENTSFTEEQWKNITIPMQPDGESYSQCEQYVVHWNNGTPTLSNDTQSCSAWQYDRSLMRETVATTNDWVCDQAMYSVHILSISSLGTSISTLVLPYIADRYTGRRIMFFVSVLFHAVFNLCLVFTSSFGLHLAFRLLAAFSFQTNYQTAYMIAVELMAPDRRALTGFISFAAWAAGCCTTSFVCWLLADWRYVIGVLLLGNLYQLSLWWYLPESPRWLLDQHRLEEAADTMLKIEKVNQQSVAVSRDVLLRELEGLEDHDNSNVSLLAVLKYPKFCRRAVSLLILSGASFLCYGIMVLNIDVLPDHYFLNFFLLSLVEVPATISSCISVQYLGRRFTAICAYFLCIFIAVLAALIVEYKIALLVVVSVLRFIFAMSQYVMDLQSTELYHTGLRTTGKGGLAVFGALMTSTVPYIIKAGMGGALNYWIITIMCVICVFCSWPLPETLQLPLPQTLEEAENIGSTRPLHKWVHNWNLHKYKPV